MKRVFDFVFSIIGILILSPVLIIIAVAIKIDSKGPIIYEQRRVGLNNMDFSIYKFRTMYIDSDKKGLITIGDDDPRVTKIGYYLRKSKLDELPQLFNVLFGQMSIVGPRPEVRKYVDLYKDEDLVVLNVKPGITDYASIYFRNESEILKVHSNPDEVYKNEILPKKLELNKKYISNNSILKDITIVLKTVESIFRNQNPTHENSNNR